MTENPSTSNDVETASSLMPPYNVPEKIILVLDTAEDENSTSFLNDPNPTPKKQLDVLKASINMFLENKRVTSILHEFALAVLRENSVEWLVSFTDNTVKISKAMESVSACKTEDIFNLNLLFDMVNSKVPLPNVNKFVKNSLSQQYVVRVILFYGRSYTLPKLERNEAIEKMFNSRHFVLDVLMTHEQADDNNNCDKILGLLRNLDARGVAYFFSVGRDIKELFKSVAMLTGHPFQRPLQGTVDHSLNAIL